MKKVIVIGIIFSITIACSIGEVLYTTSVYEEIYDGLISVRQSMDGKEDVKNDETTELVSKVTKVWKDNKEILFCLGNHNVLRNVDEKLVSLQAMTDINYTDDAKVALEIAINLIEAIQNDAVPNLTNLF